MEKHGASAAGRPKLPRFIFFVGPGPKKEGWSWWWWFPGSFCCSFGCCCTYRDWDNFGLRKDVATFFLAKSSETSTQNSSSVKVKNRPPVALTNETTFIVTDAFWLPFAFLYSANNDSTKVRILTFPAWSWKRFPRNNRTSSCLGNEIPAKVPPFLMYFSFVWITDIHFEWLEVFNWPS